MNRSDLHRLRLYPGAADRLRSPVPDDESLPDILPVPAAGRPSQLPGVIAHLLLATALQDALEAGSGAVVEVPSGLLRGDLSPAEVPPLDTPLASTLGLSRLLRNITRLDAELRRPGVLLCAERDGTGCRLWAGRVPPAGPGFAVLLPATPPTRPERLSLTLAA